MVVFSISARPWYSPSMDQLIDSISTNGSHSPEALRLLDTLAKPRSAVGYFQSILSDQQKICRIASKSFPHPLGFDKIVLEQNQDGMKLRLHFWDDPNSISQSKPDIHDHFWSFSSALIIGEYESVTYSDSDEYSEQQTYHYYELHSPDHKSFQQKYIGARTLGVIERRRITAPTIYSVNSNELHTLLPAGSESCASIVLQEPAMKTINRIYSQTPPQSARKIVDEKPLSPGELETKLYDAIRILSDMF